MAQYFFDLLYTFTDCMCCFPNSPQLKINNRSFKLLRLLGEVGRPRFPLTTLPADRKINTYRAASPTSTSSRTRQPPSSSP